MKTNEELNALKEEVKTLNKKLVELSEEELQLACGGLKHDDGHPAYVMQASRGLNPLVDQTLTSGSNQAADAGLMSSGACELLPYVSEE